MSTARDRGVEEGVPEPAPLRRVVSLHADDAAFFWFLRSKAVRRPQYGLDDLARLDARVEAHLDGLRVAGDVAWTLVEERLEIADAGEVFAAAVLALERGDDLRLQKVLRATAERPWGIAGLVSALGWVGWERAQGTASRLVRSPEAELCAAGLRAWAVNRRDPGRPLAEALGPKMPAVVAAAACRSAGELGRTDLLPHIEWYFRCDDDDLRFWSAWSAALLGSRRAPEALAALAEGASPWRARAAATAARTMGIAANAVWFQRLSRDPAQARRAAMAAGAGGDPAAVPWLIEAMRKPETARVAGEAFSLITGADLALRDLEGDKPADFEAGPTDDPADENVSPDPDENLPWPDAERVSGWWRRHGPLPLGKRYLLGRPVTRESLRAVLRAGKQRQRIAAAEELRLHDPRQALLECRAPGFLQLRAG